MNGEHDLRRLRDERPDAEQPFVLPTLSVEVGGELVERLRQGREGPLAHRTPGPLLSGREPLDEPYQFLRLCFRGHY